MSTASFSYAQAARGQMTPQIVTPPLSNPVPPMPTSAEGKDDGCVTTASRVSGPSTIFDTDKHATKAPYTETSPSSRKVDSDTASAADSATLVGTLGESTSNFSVDDLSHAVASDKNDQVSVSATASSSPDDIARNDRKDKSSKTPSKDGDQSGLVEEKDATKAELSPAPLPIVNIWDQRRRDLAAKSNQHPIAISKATTTMSPSTSKPSANSTPPKFREPKKATSLAMDGDTDTELGGSAVSTKSQTPRSNDTRTSEQTRRNGPRGSRVTEKDDKVSTARDSLPSVQDASLWPTPESAAFGEDPKAKGILERTETADKEGQEEAGSAKSRKKGWVPLPFVPSVNFQTPIPSVRGSKPKTGSRGGRDSSRGGYNGITNGSALPERLPSATAFSGEKMSDPRDPPKETNGNATSRHISQMSNSSKRFSTDTIHSREPRKSSGTVIPDKSKDATPISSELSGKVDLVSKASHTNAINGTDKGLHHASHSAQSDRRSASTVKNGDAQPSGKESGLQLNKEHQGLPFRERTEAKIERAARGGYRGGRGGHGGTSQNHHLSHSTFQPNGQRIPSNGASASYGINSLPPTAVPYSPPSHFAFGTGHNSQRPNRNSGRTQSLSHTHAFGSRLQTSVGNASRLHTNAPHAAASFTAEFQVQPYPLATYSPYMDPDLLRGLVTQLEYYFSVENLCKDVFLRKKMNDQGFVPLSVVASFKRMAKLAPSIDFIRTACEQASNLDYIVDQDQNEMIRSRFHWNNFILPTEERDDEARKPGPDIRNVHIRSIHSRPPHSFLPSFGYPPMLSAMFPANGNDGVYQAYANGMHTEHSPVRNDSDINGRPYAGESQLSAAVPDFSPSSTNGALTALGDYQNYPDEELEKSVAYVGSDADATLDGQLSQSPDALPKPAGHAAQGGNLSGLQENHSR